MKVLALNKRAKFDYHIEDRLVAGLVLSGPEVKSAKLGQVSLKGSFVTVKNDELYLVNAHINPYAMAADANGEPTRSRKLLLHRNQIKQIIGYKTSGLSAVPIALISERGLIKLELGVGRGKKRLDKRETIKKRDQLRDAARETKA